jgi:hypothetical protein
MACDVVGFDPDVRQAATDAGGAFDVCGTAFCKLPEVEDDACIETAWTGAEGADPPLGKLAPGRFGITGEGNGGKGRGRIGAACSGVNPGAKFVASDESGRVADVALAATLFFSCEPPLIPPLKLF